MSRQCAALEELASAWVADALDAGERAQMAAHLERCAACRGAVDDLARTRMLLRSLPVRQVPAGLFADGFPPADGHVSVRRRAGIRPGEAGRVSMRDARRRIAARAAATFAVITGLVGGAAFELGGQPEPGARMVQVPLDVYAVDHLVRTVGSQLSTLVLVNGVRK